MLPRTDGAAERLNQQAMQTLKNNQDVTLKSWPASLPEWDTNPVIIFTVPHNMIVHPKDRIYCTTKMIKQGRNSGDIKDIYYYIENILDVRPNKVHMSNTEITATAKRIEI